MSSSDFADILTPLASGVRLTVRAKPGLSRARAIKAVDIGDGKRAVEVSVSADAREGKANKALVERLAEECGVSKKQVSIVSGETARFKIVDISGEPQHLMQALKILLSRAE
ncbi:MAG: DUF167 domain-containing protein [Alphaproteobacteria bacterium]|nr:DUF167 domain-containing protein [Alphaproteobacteria bacterium]